MSSEQEQIGENAQKNEETIPRRKFKRPARKDPQNTRKRLIPPSFCDGDGDGDGDGMSKELRERLKKKFLLATIPRNKEDVHKDMMLELEQHIKEKDSQKKKEAISSRVYMPMLYGSMKKAKDIVTEMLSYVKTMEDNEGGTEDMNKEKETAKGKLSAMILKLKPAEEVKIKENEEDDITEDEINKLIYMLSNIKDKHEELWFRTSALNCLWRWQRDQRLIQDCIRDGLALYNTRERANFVLDKICHQSFHYNGRGFDFHLNFFAKSTADDKMHMFFVEAKGPLESMNVTVCCRLDDDVGVKRGCRFCVNEIFHPSDLVALPNRTL